MSPSKYDPCRRGCCWNPWNTCSTGRLCECHSELAAWLGVKPAPETASPIPRPPDPTGNTAIRNVMKERHRK